MQVRIEEDNSIVRLVTDRVNGYIFDLSVAQRMFEYRSKEYGIVVPSKYVLLKLNNYARACYKLPFVNNTALIPLSKLTELGA